MRRMRTIAFILAVAVFAAGCGKNQDSNSELGDLEAWDNEEDDSEIWGDSDAEDDSDIRDGDDGFWQEEEGSEGDTPESDNPAFTGDTLELFGLDETEASELLGEGSVLYGRTIKSENGIEVYLNNSVDNIDVYTVQCVAISADAGVSFHGIKVGDSLKDTDKILMDADGHYMGGLKWNIAIEDSEYEVCLTTEDEKTVASIEATLAQDYSGQDEYDLSGNPYAYEEDLHDLEPQYWE